MCRCRDNCRPTNHVGRSIAFISGDINKEERYLMKILRGLVLVLIVVLALSMLPAAAQSDASKVVISQIVQEDDVLSLYFYGLDSSELPTSASFSADQATIRTKALTEPVEPIAFQNAKQDGAGTSYFFLIDVSKSIKKDQLDQIKQCIKDFVDSTMGPADCATIIAVGTEATELVKFSSNKSELHNAIDSLSINADYTHLHEAIVKAQTMDVPAGAPKRGCIIVMSDAGDDSDNKATVQEIMNNTERYHIPVFSVVFKGTGKFTFGEMASICRRSQGVAYAAQGDVSISQAFDNIKRIIDSSYVARVKLPYELSGRSAVEWTVEAGGMKSDGCLVNLSSWSSGPITLSELTTAGQRNAKGDIAEIEGDEFTVSWWTEGAIKRIVLTVGSEELEVQVRPESSYTHTIKRSEQPNNSESMLTVMVIPEDESFGPEFRQIMFKFVPAGDVVVSAQPVVEGGQAAGDGTFEVAEESFKLSWGMKGSVDSMLLRLTPENGEELTYPISVKSDGIYSQSFTRDNLALSTTYTMTVEAIPLNGTQDDAVSTQPVKVRFVLSTPEIDRPTIVGEYGESGVIEISERDSIEVEWRAQGDIAQMELRLQPESGNAIRRLISIKADGIYSYTISRDQLPDNTEFALIVSAIPKYGTEKDAVTSDMIEPVRFKFVPAVISVSAPEILGEHSSRDDVVEVAQGESVVDMKIVEITEGDFTVEWQTEGSIARMELLLSSETAAVSRRTVAITDINLSGQYTYQFKNTDVSPRSVYTLTVRAIPANGSAEHAVEQSLKFEFVPGPIKVSPLTVSGNNDSEGDVTLIRQDQFTVSWSTEGRAAKTVLVWGAADEVAQSLELDAGARSHTFSAKDMRIGVDYTVSVSVSPVNGTDEQAQSSEVKFRIPVVVEAPAAPKIDPLAPTSSENNIYYWRNADKFTISWKSDSDSNVETYIAELFDATTDAFIREVSDDKAVRQYTFTAVDELSSGVVYKLRVTAVPKNGTREDGSVGELLFGLINVVKPEISVEFPGDYQEDSGIVMIPGEQDTFTVRWQADAEVESYSVRWGDNSDEKTEKEVYSKGQQTEHVFTTAAMTPGTQYWIEVTAIPKGGTEDERETVRRWFSVLERAPIKADWEVRLDSFWEGEDAPLAFLNLSRRSDFLMIFGGALLILIALVVIAVILIRKRSRDKSANANMNGPLLSEDSGTRSPIGGSYDAEPQTVGSFGEETIPIGGMYGGDLGDATIQLDSRTRLRLTARYRGAEKVVEVSLDKGEQELIMGRDAGARISLSEVGDQSISSRHAIIYNRVDALYIADNHSRNGTKLNGIPITSETPLRSGDVILMGETSVSVEIDMR